MLPDPTTPGSGPPRRRRERYPGTHPRRFGQRYKEQNLDKFPEIETHVRAQGRTPAGTHVPIMLDEVIASLRPGPGEIVADLTLGYGGHALAFLERSAPDGRLIGLDLDGPQLESTTGRLRQLVDPARLHLHHSHFAGLPKIIAGHGLDAVDVLFADLGLSSMQIDNPDRGFSYKHDGPLDMRMDLRRPQTAADILRTISVEDLSSALHELADEPLHDEIARAIVRRRAERPIARTDDLVELILTAHGLTRRSWRAAKNAEASRRREARGASFEPMHQAELGQSRGRSTAGDTGGSRLHPAARTFQALRILVNDELDGLAQLLRVAPYCLRPGGRLGILTFHSGEDRRVKHALRDGLRDGIYSQIAEEPLRPTPAERHANPRSASAKFRWALRTGMA